MTETNNLPQDDFVEELTQLSVKFLKFIKINHDEGKSLYIKDFMEHFNYNTHQVVSKYLDKLEDKLLIESHWEDGKRVISITQKGLDLIYTVGCSYFSGFERLLIRKLRRDGDLNASMGTITSIISEFTRNLTPDQDSLIKNIILREFGSDVVPESALNNICRKFRQIQLESGRKFIENYGIKKATH